MEPKVNEITTIEQLIEIVTPENFETLASDLRYFLALHLNVKNLGTDAVQASRVFQWIDDNESGLRQINVDMTQEPKKED